MTTSKILKAIIIDDEPYARKDLKALLSEFSEIQVVGEADSVINAKQVLELNKPDIVFLDIEMPGKTGFDLLEIEDLKAKIIFVTAHDEYAIRAFEVNAQDYLLKPVSRERLKKALSFITEDVDTISENPKGELNVDDCIYLMINNKYHFIRINKIIYISAANDCTEIHTSDGQDGIVFKSLKEWENRLPKNYFVRIHRSTIINIEMIGKIEKWFNNSFKVVLKGVNKEFVISRRYAAQIKHRYS